MSPPPNAYLSAAPKVPILNRVKGQLQADSLLVELTFILLSLISQGDSLIACELDVMLFCFTSNSLQLNHKKIVIA